MAMVAWLTIATSKGGDHPCRQVLPLRLWLFFASTQHEQSSYTVHIHAALGGGEPRWRPLYVAVTTSELQDAGEELPDRWHGDGVYSCDRTMAALHLPLGQTAAAWKWRFLHCAGFQILLFVFVLFIFGLVFNIFIVIGQ
jgi:hypothetical protein